MMNIQRLPLNPGGSKKPNYVTQCWEINPYLPIEVIQQILLLLPPKSIGRCRCVSKQWLALLSSPQFIKAHTSIIRTQAPHAQSVSIFSARLSMCFTLINDNQVTASGAHHNFHLPWHTCFMGSCDGLILVLGKQPFLINPTTGHTMEIPSVITHHVPDPMTPTNTVTLDGIGFDSVSHDYKVVSVSQIYNPKAHDSSHDVFVHIYSVNGGTWKSCISLPNFFGYRFNIHWSRGVFVGRCIHWLIRRDTDGIPVIVAFDVVEEKLCQLPNPTHHSFKHLPHRYTYRLGVVAGCLCVITMSGGYLNVWVMNQYGIQESWTRIARIGGIKEAWFAPLCFLDQENLVLQYHKVNGHLEKLVTYNVAEKTLKDIDIPDGIKELDYITIPFAETMVSPYGMRGEC